MIWILLAMLGTLVLAGLVVVYVAFPHRGADVPSVPWVGDVLRKGVEMLPTLPDPDAVNRRDQAPAARR
jgi:hypothetical protein